MSIIVKNSMSNSESEADFWIDFDKPPILIKKSDNSSFFRKTKLSMEYIDKFKSQLSEFLPGGYQKERIYVVIDRIRDAARAEHEITLQTSLTSLHRFYKKKIHKLSEDHLTFMQDLRDDYDRLQLQLTKKDIEILRLQSMLCTQEDFINRQRITQETLIQPLPQPSAVSNIDAIKKKKKTYKLQLSHFRDLVSMYHTQTDEAREDLAKLQRFLKEREKQFAEKEEELRNSMAQQAQDHEELMKEQQKKFDKYTHDTNNELEICHLVNQRQIELISTLQNELRSAKIVLQTPRLKIKYNQKVRTASMTPVANTRYKDKKMDNPLKRYFDRGNKVWSPHKKRGD